MSWFSTEHLHQLILTYGYVAVAGMVAVESMGLPVPGETILILSAIYAATHHDLNIWGVITFAAAGAILGDNVGYWLGRTFGYALLLRYGRYIGLSDARTNLPASVARSGPPEHRLDRDEPASTHHPVAAGHLTRLRRHGQERR